MSSKRSISLEQFPAKCLILVERVASTGKPIVITKRGKPVARVVPVEPPPPDLRGSVLKETDLVSPIDTSWDAT